MKYLSTRPFVNVEFIREDEFKRLLAIITIICVFIWYNRQTFLTLADNINQLFQWLNAIRATWLIWQYSFNLLLNPFQYGPG